MSTQELEKGFSAMPSDVRKASGLPKDECHHEFKLARLRLANLREGKRTLPERRSLSAHRAAKPHPRSLLLDGSMRDVVSEKLSRYGWTLASLIFP